MDTPVIGTRMNCGCVWGAEDESGLCDKGLQFWREAQAACRRAESCDSTGNLLDVGWSRDALRNHVLANETPESETRWPVEFEWREIKTAPWPEFLQADVEMIFVTSKGRVFAGHLHSNGWAYSSSKTGCYPARKDAAAKRQERSSEVVTAWAPLPSPPQAGLDPSDAERAMSPAASEAK